MRFLTFLVISLLTACASVNEYYLPVKDPQLSTLPDFNAHLEFTCKYEAMPAPSPNADILFKYARWLQKNNQLASDPAVQVEIERLYRISAESSIL